jgi:hypothetical protein
MTADMSDVYAEAAAALVATFRIGSSAAADGGAEYTTTAWFRAAVDVAYERGLAEGRAERANRIDALTRGAYEDGKGDGRAEGRRQATEGEPYTAHDVETVATWFKRQLGASSIRARDREYATEVLAALAAAGRRLVGPREPDDPCTCPPLPPNAGAVNVNRGHLIGCPALAKHDGSSK